MPVSTKGRPGGFSSSSPNRPTRSVTLWGDLARLDPITIAGIAGAAVAGILVLAFVAGGTTSMRRGDVAAAFAVVLLAAFALLYAWRNSDGRQGGPP